MTRYILVFLVLLSSPVFAAIALLPHVGTNADLMAAKSTAYPIIVRDGFTTAGDVSPLSYAASNVVCSLNAGNGDNGSQVKSADNKCWLASFPAAPIDIRQWGAKCDGTTDDSAALIAADAATGFGSLGVLKTCRLSNNVTLVHSLYIGPQGALSVDVAKTLSVALIKSDAATPFPGAGTVTIAARGLSPLASESAIFNLQPERSGEAGISGNAPLKFAPALSDTHTQGLFIQPTIGTFATNQYPSAIFQKWGDVGTPVPAGTKAYLYGYQCGIYSSQASSDTPSDNGGCLGSTIILNNGAYYAGATLTATIGTVPSNYKGVNINVENNIAMSGTSIFGVYAGSTGSQNGSSAFAAGAVSANKWLNAFDAVGLPVVDVTGLFFATPTASVATDYSIIGSLTDTFRIQGGGSAGGMIVFGTTNGVKAKGNFQWQNDAVDGVTEALVDFASGNFRTAGNVSVGSTTALTLSSGMYGLQTITNPAAAPGAAGGAVYLICSGTAGKAKLVAVAGTSGTVATILDNIGSGVTGC